MGPRLLPNENILYANFTPGNMKKTSNKQCHAVAAMASFIVM